MYSTLLYNVYRLIDYGSCTLQELSYKLTVIEDEEVPLAPGLSGGTRFLPITLALMAAILIGTIVSVYYFKCRHYQKRILRYKQNGLEAYSGWNLKKLKEALMEIQLEVVDFD